jgi:WD40 repeat protein
MDRSWPPDPLTAPFFFGGCPTAQCRENWKGIRIWKAVWPSRRTVRSWPADRTTIRSVCGACPMEHWSVFWNRKVPRIFERWLSRRTEPCSPAGPIGTASKCGRFPMEYCSICKKASTPTRFSRRTDPSWGVCGEEIILWKYAEGKLITLRGHSKEVDAIAFSPDGLLLASGSWDATVRFWRVSDGEQLRTLENVTGWVTDLSFSSDGVLLASGSGDGTIYLWGIAP